MRLGTWAEGLGLGRRARDLRSETKELGGLPPGSDCSHGWLVLVLEDVVMFLSQARRTLHRSSP